MTKTCKAELISLVIPSRNRADILPLAINSALCQTHKNIEIIIVNDGSIDHTKAVVEEFLRLDRRVHYVEQPKAQGACAARNKGIIAAKGKLITFLDDDDIISPDRLELLLKYHNEDLAFTCSRYSEDLDKIRNPGTRTNIKAKHLSFSKLLNKNYAGNSALVAKDKLLAVGGFDEKLKAKQDYDLWVRLTNRFGKALQISAKTYYCNKSSEFVRISNSKARKRGVIQFYKKHSGKMNWHQRKNAIIVCLETNGIYPGFFKLMGLFTWRNRKKVFKILSHEIRQRKFA